MNIGDKVITTDGSVGTLRSVSGDGSHCVYFEGSNRELFFFKRDLQKYFEVGQRVTKISRKPFKSGLKVATVKSIKPNPQHPSNKLAAELVEDGTLVNVSQLEVTYQ
jgi:hypothetical protein